MVALSGLIAFQASDLYAVTAKSAQKQGMQAVVKLIGETTDYNFSNDQLAIDNALSNEPAIPDEIKKIPDDVKIGDISLKEFLIKRGKVLTKYKAYDEHGQSLLNNLSIRIEKSESFSNEDKKMADRIFSGTKDRLENIGSTQTLKSKAFSTILEDNASRAWDAVKAAPTFAQMIGGPVLSKAKKIKNSITGKVREYGTVKVGGKIIKRAVCAVALLGGNDSFQINKIYSGWPPLAQLRIKNST